jgi:glucose 1-dehydrogenase
VNETLKGQIAMVTGAGSGIGAAVAIALAEAGATVVINHPHAPQPAEDIVSQIRRNGGEAIALAADVSNEKEVISTSW